MSKCESLPIRVAQSGDRRSRRDAERRTTKDYATGFVNVVPGVSVPLLPAAQETRSLRGDDDLRCLRVGGAPKCVIGVEDLIQLEPMCDQTCRTRVFWTALFSGASGL